MNMSYKNACEQRVGILTFCQYYKVTYMFQAFIMFSQPTGGLFKSFCSVSLTLHYCFYGTDQDTSNRVN